MYLFCISCKEIVATIKVPTLVFSCPQTFYAFRATQQHEK